MPNNKLSVQRMSKLGLALLAEYEGFLTTSYFDSAGFETIGVGHVIDDHDRLVWQDKRNRKGRYVISEAEVLMLLETDVKKVEKACRLMNAGPYKNPNIFDSMCSFLFNVGTGVASQAWVRWVLKHEDIEMAERHFPHWDHAGGKQVRGLTVRRHNELAWMRKGAGQG
jgi:lysozyme